MSLNKFSDMCKKKKILKLFKQNLFLHDKNCFNLNQYEAKITSIKQLKMNWEILKK